jgi:hypothetical protein
LGASASLAVAYVSYEIFEKRFLTLKQLFATVEELAPQSPATGVSAAGLPTDERSRPAQHLPQPLVAFETKRPVEPRLEPTEE